MASAGARLEKESAHVQEHALMDPVPRIDPSREADLVLITLARAYPPAFAVLYEQHVDRIYAYVLSCCPDRMSAEDIVAETFQHALEHLDRYEWRGVPVTAWLFRIASNAIAAHYRRRPFLPLDPTVQLVDGSPGPERALLREERRAMVRAAVAALPLPQRQAVVLRYGHDLHYKEIARILGYSEGAVKQLLHRARTRLRYRLSTIEHAP